jgi:hypothetical protein
MEVVYSILELQLRKVCVEERGKRISLGLRMNNFHNINNLAGGMRKQETIE